MRDHNTSTISGTLKAAPEVFSTSTKKGCKFNVLVRDEWRNADTGATEERYDEIHVICHGPVRARAVTLQEDAFVLVTGRLRTSGDKRLYLEAKTIEKLAHISPPAASDL